MREFAAATSTKTLRNATNLWKYLINKNVMSMFNVNVNDIITLYNKKEPKTNVMIHETLLFCLISFNDFCTLMIIIL